MIYVGIDLHTTNMVIVALNGNGEVVQEAKILTSTKALEKFFGEFDPPVKAVVECIPKGSLWERAVHAGQNPSVAPAMAGRMGSLDCGPAKKRRPSARDDKDGRLIWLPS